MSPVSKKDPTKLEVLFARMCNNTEMKKQLLEALQERQQMCLSLAQDAALSAVFSPSARDNAVALLALTQEYDAYISFVDKQ